MCGRGLLPAADESGLSDRAVPFRQSGIPYHHLPNRSAKIARAGPRAAADRGAAGQIRIHPHAGFDRFRRLYRERSGRPGEPQGPQRRLLALHVSRRSSADRRRPRALGLSKKIAKPTLHDEIDTLVGTLDYGSVRIATGSMGYKHKTADHDAVMASLLAPNFLLKIVPHVDGTPRICELVEYELTDVNLKGAWTGPTALTLSSHALAPLAELPVLEIVSGMHIIADLTLPLGKVVHDYLAKAHA